MKLELQGRVCHPPFFSVKQNMLVFLFAFILSLLGLKPMLGAAEPWQAEWDRALKAAEQEGELTYYTLGEVGFVSEFEKKFPRIRVRVVQGKGNELLARMMAERRAGKFLADVARIGNTSPYALYQAKALQPISTAFILPEVKDESKWWSGKHQYIDSEGKYIFVPVGSVSVNMVAYNTETVVPAELHSFWDLLQEKWRAKIVVIDPRATGYGRSGARAAYSHAQLGADFLRRLFTEQVVMVSRDYRQAIDWLAQKRFAIMLFGNGDDVLQARAQGLPVNVVDTGVWKEGGMLEPGAFTLAWADKSPHPNAAKVFINWLLSREGQIAVQKDGSVNDSLRIDIPKTDVRPMARRKDGAKYMVTWKEEWIDAEPMQRVVNQALARSTRKN
ncbi:MAG: extracellular solute-binding protein [Deltaproteobacteria bacterium]|nr:extracellular solute-binding protein [Deltaproteobacteria bacterium]